MRRMRPKSGSVDDPVATAMSISELEDDDRLGKNAVVPIEMFTEAFSAIDPDTLLVKVLIAPLTTRGAPGAPSAMAIAF